MWHHERICNYPYSTSRLQSTHKLIFRFCLLDCPDHDQRMHPECLCHSYHLRHHHEKICMMHPSDSCLSQNSCKELYLYSGFCAAHPPNDACQEAYPLIGTQDLHYQYTLRYVHALVDYPIFLPSCLLNDLHPYDWQHLDERTCSHSLSYTCPLENLCIPGKIYEGRFFYRLMHMDHV